MSDLIKRSDAIKAVSKVDDYGDGIGFEVRSHCLVELELVPSADRPQGDFVSKRYLLAEIDDLADEFSEVDENGLHSERWCGISDAKCVIVNAPSVADRPQGEWTKAYDGIGGRVKCTNCLKTYDWDSEAQYYNYCPNCGARMKGVDDE